MKSRGLHSEREFFGAKCRDSRLVLLVLDDVDFEHGEIGVLVGEVDENKVGQFSRGAAEHEPVSVGQIPVWEIEKKTALDFSIR